MDEQKLIVETQYFTCCQDTPLVLKSGEKLGPITLAYETYGTLNSEKSNAIFLFHSLTMDAHAAGYRTGEDKPGWWDSMIGPGKALDTEKYFIICSNVIGSCKGSTGPASINPKTNKVYGLSFPVITIKDMVNAQKYLIDHLGIEKLLCAIGGSMGGLQAVQWAVDYPDMVESCVVIASNTKHTAQQIGLHEVARQAIMTDPDWNEGNYYEKKSVPSRGMAIARMIAHITYMSEISMEEKFGRKLQDKEKLGYDFTHDFQVESYLKYRGASFVSRFDANSYLYLSKALDYFDMTENCNSLVEAFKPAKCSFLIVSFSSDWLYPPHQSKAMVSALKANDLNVSDILIDSSYGHDAFLVEVDNQSKLIQHYLKRFDKKLNL